jgi:DNA-binding MarR family transcriptional regulator
MTKFNKSDLNVRAGNQIQELRYNLLQSCSWLTNNTRKLLKPYGITPKQYSILGNLAKDSPKSASIQEVRDGLADKMSDASRLIDRLVKKGYLDKFPSDFDRRSNRVRISDSGIAILKEINARKEDLERMVSDLLNENEITELNRLLCLLK